MKNLENNLLEYDEDVAIQFIRQHLPLSLKDRFSDDELNYFIDLIYDFYEEKGLLKEDDETVDIDLDELTAYVVRNARNDEIGNYSEEEIRYIIEGEMAYCDSLGIFEEEDE